MTKPEDGRNDFGKLHIRICWLVLTLCTITLLFLKSIKSPELDNMSWWFPFLPLLLPVILASLYIGIIFFRDLIRFIFLK